jgi:hypothetical protein
MRIHYGKPRRVYQWVKYQCGNSYGILGPFNSEEEANEKAISDLHGYQYEIVPLDTRNKAAASGKLKAVILHDTRDLGQAIQRIKHKVPQNVKPNLSTEVHFL